MVFDKMMVETEIDSQNIKKMKKDFFFKFIDRITVISENMKEFISGRYIEIYQFRAIFRFGLGINVFIGFVFANKIIMSVFLFEKKAMYKIVVGTETRDIKWIKTTNDSQSILFF